MTVRQSEKRGVDNLALATLALSLAAVFLVVTAPAYTPSAGAQPNATSITLSPSPATISGCDVVTVSIMINDVVGLYGADVRLAFDPNMLEVVDANTSQSGVQSTPGGLLTGSLYTVYNTADNSLGTLRYAATQISPTLPFDGTGSLLKIMFRAKVSGTSNITFTFTQLGDRNGQAIAATATNGSAILNGPPAPTVSIGKLNATDAHLSWAASVGAAEYRIYRSTTPYFTPVDPPSAVTANLSYDDASVLGDTATNYYYVIKSACTNGLKSSDSNRVGEFDFAIARNAYNTIALPLIDPGLTTADQLGSAVNATKVSRWIASTQLLGTRIVGVTGTNFGLSVGQGYFVYTPDAGNSILTVVGEVPAAGSLTFPISRGGACYLNLLSLPLDHSTISNADSLATAIGGVPSVKEWRAATSVFATRVVGVVGSNFATRIGYPYWPCADTSGGGPTWP